MALVVAGFLNKQIAGEFNISEITVEAHRGKAMRKMQANSLADLVKMAAGLSSRRRRTRLASANADICVSEGQ
jgi:FixJ family two-component response regulator